MKLIANSASLPAKPRKSTPQKSKIPTPPGQSSPSPPLGKLPQSPHYHSIKVTPYAPKTHEYLVEHSGNFKRCKRNPTRKPHPLKLLGKKLLNILRLVLKKLPFISEDLFLPRFSLTIEGEMRRDNGTMRAVVKMHSAKGHTLYVIDEKEIYIDKQGQRVNVTKDAQDFASSEEIEDAIEMAKLAEKDGTAARVHIDKLQRTRNDTFYKKAITFKHDFKQ